jgi:hypothetical protein
VDPVRVDLVRGDLLMVDQVGADPIGVDPAAGDQAGDQAILEGPMAARLRALREKTAALPWARCAVGRRWLAALAEEKKKER